MIDPNATTDCALCGTITRMTGTKRCNSCWELERRIKLDPKLARQILAELDAGRKLRRFMTGLKS